MKVIIQPSFGNPVARNHWADTMAKELRFTTADRSSLLTPAQSQALAVMHPTGSCRFWGATRAQDTNMSTVVTGDVVLFTGKKRIQGVGEVGVSFQNAGFADALWSPDVDKGSWHNVYSVLSFTPTDLPYDNLQAALGVKPTDNFMGMRVIRDERVATIVDALGLATITADRATTTQMQRVAADLAARYQTGQIIAPEAANVGSTTYLRAQQQIIARRTESLLVDAYKRSLPAAATINRIRCQGGLTDLYVGSANGDFDLLEAKASADHAYIRQALGQLLDYLCGLGQPVTTLTVLTPSRPSGSDIHLLHTYGIDLVYEDHGSFTRLACPEERRHLWWQTQTT